MWLKLERLSDSRGAYADALGRALVVAQNFESNAKYTLGIAQLDHASSLGTFESFDDLLAFGGKMMKRWLRDAIDNTPLLKERPREQVELLIQGVDARNYLAHEAAAGLSYDREPSFLERLAKFKSKVSDLAAADNLVSSWSFEIQEKAAAPMRIRSQYEARIVRWVLEPIQDLLPVEENIG